MKTLLKDMPEHMERVDGNQVLQMDITDILSEYSDWSESRKTNVIDDSDFSTVSGDILEKITEFVNQNYEWKGVKS